MWKDLAVYIPYLHLILTEKKKAHQQTGISSII